MSQRLGWVDYARGIGIILVVFAHNLGGQLHANLGLPTLLNGVIPYAYSFHMPLFFFLSGLFVMHSYRKGFRTFVKSKIATIFYPFIIWSLIQAGIESGMGGYINHPTSILQALPNLFVRPVGQMWFLEALLCMFLFFAVLRRLGVPPWVFLLIACGTAFAFPYAPLLIVGKIWLNMIFLAVAVCFHQPINRWLQGTRTGWLAAFCALAGILQLAAIFGPFIAAWNAPERVLVAMLGIAGAVSLSELLVRIENAGWLFMHWLKVVGQYTMPIFLMHTIFGSGMRIVLARLFMLYDPWLHAGVELAAGILLPMGTAYVLTGLNAVGVFEWPVRRPAKLAS